MFIVSVAVTMRSTRILADLAASATAVVPLVAFYAAVLGARSRNLTDPVSGRVTSGLS